MHVVAAGNETFHPALEVDHTQWPIDPQTNMDVTHFYFFYICY